MADIKRLNEFYRELVNKGAKLTNQFQLSFSNIGIATIEKALENITMWAAGADAPGRTQNVAELSLATTRWNPTIQHG